MPKETWKLGTTWLLERRAAPPWQSGYGERGLSRAAYEDITARIAELHAPLEETWQSCGRFAALALLTLGLYSCCRTDEHVATYKEVVKQLTTYLSEVNDGLVARGVAVVFMLDIADGELLVSIDAKPHQ